MKEIIRNILRRKVRSFLTIFGISIGIFALTVMGSMTEYFNNLIDRSIRYSSEIVRVYPKSAAAGPASGILPVSEVDQFKKIPEVGEVAPALFTNLDDSSNGNPLSGNFVIGLPPQNSEALFGKVGLSAGRYLKKEDTKEALIGIGVARKFNLKIGSKKTIKGKEFEIVGIGRGTQVDQIDNLAILPLSAVQESAKLTGFANAVILIPKNKTDAQKIADTVKKDFPRYNALSPEDIVTETKKGLLIFNVIILAGALLAAIVGGFSTLNTMIMAISERTREIGIKKAIGATAFDIVKEYLLESALIGFLGGLLGVSLGWLGTIAINSATQNLANGLMIFTFTPRLGVTALLFATILGSLAGLLPAVTAARMNIVKALKEL